MTVDHPDPQYADGNARPKIRDVQLVPYEHNGQPGLLVRDPLQLNGHSLIIPETLAPVIFACDGRHDFDQIADLLLARFGLHADREDLEAIVAAFDEVFLVENDRYRAARDRAVREFRAAPYRQPASAGHTYPADPAALHHYFQDLLESVDVEPDPEPIAGILSPHIDFARGGLTYAGIWKRAARAAAGADLVIAIGTDHYSDHPITLTRQNYATPFGVLQTDRDIVDRLARAIGEDAAFEGELFHRSEHSLELPLAWLHHFAGDRELSVVPILCGNLDPGSPRLQALIAALQTAVRGRRVFTVISGDLAHVGPAFGGRPQTAEDRRRVRETDAHLMDLLARADAGGFLAAIRATGNGNNVCGTYPLYLGLAAFGYASGEPIGYDQCEADDPGESFVSIGGMAFKS